MKIKASAERASTIIQDLLILSRKRKIDSVALSLNMLVDEYLESEYRDMAADQVREQEALEWTEAMMGDVDPGSV